MHRITKTPGVCGGSACIAGTRIPVWLLVEIRGELSRDGEPPPVVTAELLDSYPTLRAEDLEAAWRYAEQHAQEIATEIHENEVD